MRAFIASPLSQEFHAELVLLQRRLDKPGNTIRWLKPNNIHLTLKFLRSINDKQLKKIVPLLTTILKSHKSFAINLSGVGFFPNIHYPRVIWIGVKKGKKECERLQNDIEDSLACQEIEKNKKPFSPHFTIGRIKYKDNKPAPVSLIKNGNNYRLEATALVKRIVLFQSILTPKGPIYKEAEKFQLH